MSFGRFMLKRSSIQGQKLQIILLSVIFCKFIMHDNFSSKTDEVISLCGGVIIS
jgi:hypothetical protein